MNRLLTGCISIRANGARVGERDSLTLPSNSHHTDLSSLHIKKTILRVLCMKFTASKPSNLARVRRQSRRPMLNIIRALLAPMTSRDKVPPRSGGSQCCHSQTCFRKDRPGHSKGTKLCWSLLRFQTGSKTRSSRRIGSRVRPPRNHISAHIGRSGAAHMHSLDKNTHLYRDAGKSCLHR